MVGRRPSTVAFALVVCLAFAGGLSLGAAAEADPSVSGEAAPPLVEPQLLALAEKIGDRRPPPARSLLGRGHRDHPLGPAPRLFERGPRTCLVEERCPSEPCVQFIAGKPRGAPSCDRFPDPGDARMLPLSRP